MGVIRVEHTSNYTVMSNEHLRDPRLSLRAMGLMSRMLSDSDNYQHSIAGLAAVCKEGRDAVRKALQELEAAGYLVRTQTRSGGSFSACDYTLFEHSTIPCEPPLTENPTTVPSPLTEKPSTGNPTTENPMTVNPTQRNTNVEEITSKEPPIAPQKGGRRRKREQTSTPDWKPERFEKFWSAYPRGEAKQAAARAWDKLKADDDLLAVMGRALVRQMRSDSWRQGVGIPYASTWLNQRRWEDEPRGPATVPPPDPEGRTDLQWF